MGQTMKTTFSLRLRTSTSEVDSVLYDVVVNGETYVVKATNTMKTKRNPDDHFPVAVIMSYEEYERLTKQEPE